MDAMHGWNLLGNMTEGVQIVKGTRTTPVLYPTSNGPDTKWLAIQDCRPCFDTLRRSFFLSGHGPECSAHQQLVALVYGTLDAWPAFGDELNSVAQLLLADLHAMARVAEAPQGFNEHAIDPFAAAIESDAYWFSVTDLLFVCKAVSANVAAME